MKLQKHLVRNISTLITVVPALIYYFTYLYEKAYAEVNRVPESMIQLSISDVLNLIARAIIGITLFIMPLIYVYDTVMNWSTKKIHYYVIANLTVLFCFITFYFTATFAFNYTTLYSMIIGANLIVFILSLLATNKVADTLGEDAISLPESFECYKKYIKEALSHPIVLFLIISWIIGAGRSMVETAGQYNAVFHNEWYVLKDKSESYLVANYGDKYIFRDYNNKAKKWTDTITIITGDQTKKFELLRLHGTQSKLSIWSKFTQDWMH
ncbi:hypothetical protein [Mucilaginibacter sp. KACC 22063]|uniref:hypothetical protein n=1 Tax=Mucilaginibacter sp. KACC 22063 TaxID=3025666 RepID=UPI0023661BBE|nr:hypothetical protein [Mucilaginibacter sp. KACC 22063]WDF53481.1 hypothetical protein PQ461_11050 [Mucilaginibacter sp. KACC 22063]